MVTSDACSSFVKRRTAFRLGEVSTDFIGRFYLGNLVQGLAPKQLHWQKAFENDVSPKGRTPPGRQRFALIAEPPLASSCIDLRP